MGETSIVGKAAETRKQAETEEKKDLVESRGVGLKESEWVILDELAKRTGKRSYHDIMQKLAREYISKLPRDKDGNIKLAKEETEVLP